MKKCACNTVTEIEVDVVRSVPAAVANHHHSTVDTDKHFVWVFTF